MAYRLRLYCDFDWVGDGTGSAGLGLLQSNNPGTGGSTVGGIAGAAGCAQTLRLQQAEQIPGGDSPTAGNFSTALTNGATDLNAQITAAILAQMQAWSTGGS